MEKEGSRTRDRAFGPLARPTITNRVFYERVKPCARSTEPRG
jgi:hypothetical protein